MPNGPTLLAFTLAAAVVVLAPGPAIAYVVTRSLESGRLAGLSSALGVGTGTFIHAVAASTGLAALLSSTQWAFTTIQLAGSGYLMHLGIRQLRSSRTDPGRTGRRRAPTSTARHFMDGVVVNVLNPKSVLFFIAFLPQFVDPTLGPNTQLIILALCVVPLGYLANVVYALLAARLAAGIGRAPLAHQRINRCAGAVYLGLAVFMLLA